ncbi:hypothetical protein ES705_14974 [subsurface metagenome]
MKAIITLKAGDIILAYDFEYFRWITCKVNRTEKSLITLEYIEGNLKGSTWYENIAKIRNPDYYRMAGS